jgi:hypothetical protein
MRREHARQVRTDYARNGGECVRYAKNYARIWSGYVVHVYQVTSASHYRANNFMEALNKKIAIYIRKKEKEKEK